MILFTRQKLQVIQNSPEFQNPSHGENPHSSIQDFNVFCCMKVLSAASPFHWQKSSIFIVPGPHVMFKLPCKYPPLILGSHWAPIVPIILVINLVYLQPCTNHLEQYTIGLYNHHFSLNRYASNMRCVCVTESCKAKQTWKLLSKFSVVKHRSLCGLSEALRHGSHPQTHSHGSRIWDALYFISWDVR